VTIEIRGRTPICRAQNGTIKEIRKYYEIRKNADPSFTTKKFAALLGIPGGTLRAWFATKTNPTTNVWQAFQNLIDYNHPVSY
jgi:DNA-binding transcriptional regulator YiaG